ncbi:MAG TPA: class I SAM-dependent methyltransferase [Lysobacter sp.]
MKIGPFVRKMMPFAMERRVAAIYRRIFVDLRAVASPLAADLARNARVLDIGGGDGELLNALLTARPDLSVTMVDIAPSVGKFLDRHVIDRVERCPATSLEQHLEARAGTYDAVLVSDVMHHIPRGLRTDFVRDLVRAVKPGSSIYIKDIEPGHAVATLSYLSDVYISGDKGVSLVSMKDMAELVSGQMPGYIATEQGLIGINPPNYLLRFHREY